MNKIDLIINWTLAVMLFAGIVIVFLKPSKEKFENLKAEIKQYTGKGHELDKHFTQAGLKINTYTYNLIRWLFLAAFFIVVVARYISPLKIGAIAFCLLGLVLLYYLSAPKIEIIKGKESPLILALNNMHKSKGEKLDDEIYDSCITLKNLAIVQRESPLSADYMFEQLLENSKKLKPYYSEMITLYRAGEDAEAFRIFTNRIGTKTAKNFGLILEKIDKINPSELTEQVSVFQDVIAEQRLTKGVKKADKDSIITTMFATVTIFALLLNFAVVVVFMDTMNLMSGVF